MTTEPKPPRQTSPETIKIRRYAEVERMRAKLAKRKRGETDRRRKHDNETKKREAALKKAAEAFAQEYPSDG